MLDPAATADAAHAAGLRYVSDSKPGMQRKKIRAGFRYLDVDGSPVRDRQTLARIKSLVIPPAWTDVWICKDPSGHLQCTGRDARGRKQSRYHPRWRQIRDSNKYERMAHFAKALPGIRERVRHDLALPGLPRQKLLATVVHLMETTHIRVGNAEYARDNKSYGLTTMRNRHLRVDGSTVTFDFQGKSRVHHTVSLEDRRISRILRQCAEIPGYELFQYLDDEGDRHVIDSADVNDYLREISGEHFTAKDFRTWAGTVLAAQILHELGPSSSAAEAKKNIVQAIKTVASHLGNTPSVCRKCYVHPAVIDAYLGSTPVSEVKHRLDEEIAEHEHALHEEERAVLALLQQRLLLEAA